MNSLIHKILLLTSLATLTGCASGAQVVNMIPQTLPAVKEAHPHTVRVLSAGGRETKWWGASQVSDESFNDALYQSLEQSGVFQEVIRTGDADYLLDVFITDVRQPVMGFNMTVSVSATWRLTDLNTGELVLDDVVLSPYTAKVGDALAGIKRLRLANEGAVRENIQKGIRKLAEMEL